MPIKDLDLRNINISEEAKVLMEAMAEFTGHLVDIKDREDHIDEKLEKILEEFSNGFRDELKKHQEGVCNKTCKETFNNFSNKILAGLGVITLGLIIKWIITQL